MGTRGCVAWGTEDNWKGVYNHWDSYPTGLGVEVWEEIKTIGAAKLVEGLKRCGDWREYMNGGICEYCGKKTGQPHSISGIISGIAYNNNLPQYQSKEALLEYFKNLPAWAGRENEVHEMVDDEFAAVELYRKTGFPDPEAEHHEHGSRAQAQFSSDFPDPLFIEWVYLIDLNRNTLSIFAHKPDLNHKNGYPLTGDPVKRADGYMEYGHCAYRHELVATISLDASKGPDWEEIEKSAV